MFNRSPALLALCNSPLFSLQMFICGRTASGNLVYYEEMGRIRMDKLHEHGVTVPILLKHYE